MRNLLYKELCKDWQEEGKSLGRGQWEVFAKGGKAPLTWVDLRCQIAGVTHPEIHVSRSDFSMLWLGTGKPTELPGHSGNNHFGGSFKIYYR